MYTKKNKTDGTPGSKLSTVLFQQNLFHSTQTLSSNQRCPILWLCKYHSSVRTFHSMRISSTLDRSNRTLLLHSRWMLTFLFSNLPTTTTQTRRHTNETDFNSYLWRDEIRLGVAFTVLLLRRTLTCSCVALIWCAIFTYHDSINNISLCVQRILLLKHQSKEVQASP